MAVLYARTRFDRRSGVFRAPDVHEYETGYLLETNDRQDDAWTVIQANDLPNIGDPHPFDAGALCREITARPVGDEGLLWEAIARYSTDTAETSSQDPNPLNRPVDIEWFSESNTVIVERDKDGGLIATTADEPFDPPIEVIAPRTGVRFVKNQLYFDGTTPLTYQATVNRFPFFGADPRQLLCRSTTAQRVVEGIYIYWRASYDFLFRAETWSERRINAGTWAKDGTKRKQITDKSGQAVSKPVNLSEAGAVLDIGDDPVVREFHVYPESDFNALGLL